MEKKARGLRRKRAESKQEPGSLGMWIYGGKDEMQKRRVDGMEDG